MPRGETKIAVDFVAAQLRAAVSPSVDWNIKEIDRAQELAGLFVSRGVLDLSKLTIERLDPRDAMVYLTGRDYSGFVPTETVRELQSFGTQYDEGGSYEVTDWVDVEKPISWDEYVKRQGHVPYVFVYEGKRIGFLGDINRNGSYSNAYNLFQWNNDLQIPLIAWSAQGDGSVSYCILSSPAGFGVVPYWQSSSIGDKLFFIESLQMTFAFATFALSVSGGFNITKEIGAKIIGAELAASYPALAVTVGQTAVGTVFNGGDVEAAAKSAVKSAGASALGAEIGAEVTDATDVAALGRVASAATSAYIRGGNVDAAVGLALVASIPDLGTNPSTSLPSVLTAVPETEKSGMDFFNLQNTGGGFGVPTLDTGPVFVDDSMPGFGGGFIPGYLGTSYGDEGFSFGNPLTGGFADTTFDTLAAPSTWYQDAGRWFRDTFTKDNLQTAVTVTKGVADIVKTVRNLDAPAAPPPRPGAPRVVANPNGTFTVTNASGATQVVSAAELQQMQSGGGGFNVSPGVALAGAAALAAVLFLR